MNEMIACPLDQVATRLVGAFATDIGVTLLDGLLTGPVPIALTAATVNV